MPPRGEHIPMSPVSRVTLDLPRLSPYGSEGGGDCPLVAQRPETLRLRAHLAVSRADALLDRPMVKHHRSLFFPQGHEAFGIGILTAPFAQQLGSDLRLFAPVPVRGALFELPERVS